MIAEHCMDIAALRSRFEADPNAFRVTEKDVEGWRRKTNQSLDRLCDEVAWTLAVGFDCEELPFEFCDIVINDMYVVMVPHKLSEVPGLHSGLFWEVFLAFDAGEFHARPNDDPVREYTKPFIRKIVASGRKDTQSL
jgi:hypothetical protein